jgi:hypothetical protein
MGANDGGKGILPVWSQGLDGLTITHIDVIDMITFQDGIRAYKDDAGREKIITAASHYSRPIFSSGARIGNVVDDLVVLLVHTAFLWERAFQNDNSQFAEGGNTPLAFWVFVNTFAPPFYRASILMAC